MWRRSGMSGHQRRRRFLRSGWICHEQRTRRLMIQVCRYLIYIIDNGGESNRPLYKWVWYCTAIDASGDTRSSCNSPRGRHRMGVTRTSLGTTHACRPISHEVERHHDVHPSTSTVSDPESDSTLPCSSIAFSGIYISRIKQGVDME